MANESGGPKASVSRRGFLACASMGLGAVALLASPLRGVLFGGKSNSAESGEFPGEDSIFHPRIDPRQMARDKRSGAG